MRTCVDNGLLSIHELSKLLETWGMPGKEALRTIKELVRPAPRPPLCHAKNKFAGRIVAW